MAVLQAVASILILGALLTRFESVSETPSSYGDAPCQRDAPSQGRLQSVSEKGVS